MSVEPNQNDKIVKTDKTDKMIYVYQNLFVSCVLHIVEDMKKISIDKAEKILPEKKASHENMRKTCDDVINQYKNENTDMDQAKVIKKVYKVLTQYIEFLKNRNVNLFEIRTPEGKIMTIIPGLNINLNIILMDDKELDNLWSNIETMFVTCVKMVYLITDESKHLPDVLELVNLLEKNALKKLQNNFFMGLNTEDENIVNMDQLMSSDIIIPGTEANTGILGRFGIDKLMDTENLANEIKKFDDNDINETISTLTSMLGNDSDIKDVCSTMVKSVLEDIKLNGIENMFNIAERVSGKIGNNIDPEKMAKTANGMNDLLKNNNSQLNNLKDDKGNPIGGEFFKQFQNTLNMANLFKNVGK